jgi:hypothetical protein
MRLPERRAQEEEEEEEEETTGVTHERRGESRAETRDARREGTAHA